MSDDYKNMTTEDLISLEEWMYDMEIQGEDYWFERDKILWELSSRDV